MGFFLLNLYLLIFLPSLESSPELEKAENEALAMRKQSEGLTKEYDRLLEEHAKLQVSMPWPALLGRGPSPPSRALGRPLPSCCRPFEKGADLSCSFLPPSLLDLSLKNLPSIANLDPAARTLSWAGGAWPDR